MYKWFRRIIITEFFIVIFSLIAMLFVMRDETENYTTITQSTKKFFLTGKAHLFDVQDSIYNIRGNFLPDENSEVFFFNTEPFLTKTVFPGNSRLFEFADGRYILHFYGHFTENIPKNTRLLLRCDNMSIRIRVNSVNIFEYGIDTPKPSYIKTSGNKWVSFITPEIKSDDMVQIELANSYAYHSSVSFNRFFDGIYQTTSRFVLTKETFKHFVFLFFSLIILVTGLIASLMYFILLRKKQNYEKLGLFSFTALFSSAWFILDFHYTSFFIINPEFCNLLFVSSMAMSFVCLSLYFMIELPHFLRYVVLIISEIFILYLLSGILLQYLGKCDVFDYLPSFLRGCLIISTVTIILLFYTYIKKRDKSLLHQFCSALIMFIGFNIDIFASRASKLPIMGYTKMCCAVAIVMQLNLIVKYLNTLVHKTAELKFVEQQAYRDEMTHVGNKLGWDRKVGELSQNIIDSKMFGLMVFDVNNLKQINDTYGHEEGDQLIQRACNVICNAFRRSAVFRIGGDEFVAVISSEQCCEYGNISEEALQDTLRKQFTLAEVECNKTCSAEQHLSVASGFAMTVIGEDTILSVFDRADKHMYENKNKCKEKK